MRKQTKLVAVLSAAALLAIGASMTSFAATGWTEANGVWYYYDKDGTKVEDEWKKSGNKSFWLDSEEDGAMALDKLIEYEDDFYYVDATGAMVTNTWVRVDNEDYDGVEDGAEYNYYYMQANGKAYKSGDAATVKFKTIDGKRYSFDSEGKMLYGWVTGAGTKENSAEGWSSITGVDKMYYCGNWNDGAMKTGWQKINVEDDGEEADYWFFFNTNGTRFQNDKNEKLRTKAVNGKTYGFDEKGVMVSQWNVASTSETASANNWSYFNTPEDGARVTKGWFKAIAPTDETTFTDDIEDAESFDKDNASDESVKWYYADTKGKLYAGEIVRIKGKYYAFHENGYMLSGLVQLAVDDAGVILETIDDDVDADKLDALMNAKDPKGSLYYFGNDEDSDGSMKTGNATITLDGTAHNFKFETTGGIASKGKGVNGMEDNKYIFKMGKKLKAESDDKYMVVSVKEEKISIRQNSDLQKKDVITTSSDKNKDKELVKYNDNFTDTDYLVGTSGAIVKSKTAAKDGDEWYFFVNNSQISFYANSKNLTPSMKEKK